LPKQVGLSYAKQVPPTMPVVAATHQCCVESRRLADFKTKFVIARHATGRHAGRGGGVACLSKLVLNVLSRCPPTMPVVPAIHHCCVESGCLADFKTKFVIAKHATGRHACTRGRVACLSKLVQAVLSRCPSSCMLSLPPINVALNLGA
jgi:hypothetical protein